ncbi:fungal-specific transcription factor domain-containing protein [Xylariomycetidae sp. FL0641]|nr:fungal-specific transcription factor domain-containing protein [Xylariomycetidae sp. FL0641]
MSSTSEPTDTMESNGGHPGKRQRSRRGCFTCRSRKVKCDERPGVCYNCSRLKIDCVWTSSELVQRSRINRACNFCRQRKIRCRTEDSSATCTPCQQSGLVCSKIPAPVQRMTDDAELRIMLNAFFDGPHKFFFFTFIHRPSFMQMLENDLIPRHLLLIMSATVQRIRDPGGPADAWADESRHLVMQEIFTKLSPSSLQTLLLLQRYEENQGSHLKVWLLSGLAIRVAHALQLNIEHDNQPVTIREVRRRLMWSCLVMDSLMESGARPVSGIRVSDINIRLPCTESAFLRGYESPDVRVSQSDPTTALTTFQDSISAQLVSLAMLRLKIVNYSFAYHQRNINNLPGELPWASRAGFLDLRRRLEQWRKQLPVHFEVELSQPRRIPPDEAIQLLNLHCLYHGAYCDLLRIGALLSALPIEVFPRAPAPWLDSCAHDLLYHAFAITRITSSFSSIIQECDSYATVCGCLALRLLILDRRPQDRDIVALSDPAVSQAIEGTTRYAEKVSKWSEPIRKYLSAVSDMCSKHGYNLHPNETSTTTTLHPFCNSRPPSPSLRTYGTFGAIRRDIESEDSEATTSPSTGPEKHELRASIESITAPPLTAIFPSIPNNGFDQSLAGAGPIAYNQLSAEALQTFTGWSDGTYDVTPAEALWNQGIFNSGIDGTIALFGGSGV